MSKRYKVVGTVSYLNEEGQRLPIPIGTEVAIDELESESPAAIMRWRTREGTSLEQALNLKEWAEYSKRGLKRI